MEVAQVAEILLERGQTVSVAEACTNGLLGYTLGTIPGASRFFPGGVVAYTGGLKEKILGVPDELYETAGSVSREMAIAMARGALELTGTDFALSTTGVTGPAAGRSGLPIGTFWIGLAVKDGEDAAIEIRVGGDRDATKHGAVQAAIDLLGKGTERLTMTQAHRLELARNSSAALGDAIVSPPERHSARWWISRLVPPTATDGEICNGGSYIAPPTLGLDNSATF